MQNRDSNLKYQHNVPAKQQCGFPNKDKQIHSHSFIKQLFTMNNRTYSKNLLAMLSLILFLICLLGSAFWNAVNGQSNETPVEIDVHESYKLLKDTLCLLPGYFEEDVEFKNNEGYFIYWFDVDGCECFTIFEDKPVIRHQQIQIGKARDRRRARKPSIIYTPANL